MVAVQWDKAAKPSGLTDSVEHFSNSPRNRRRPRCKHTEPQAARIGPRFASTGRLFPIPWIVNGFDLWREASPTTIFAAACFVEGSDVKRPTPMPLFKLQTAPSDKIPSLPLSSYCHLSSFQSRISPLFRPLLLKDYLTSQRGADLL